MQINGNAIHKKRQNARKIFFLQIIGEKGDGIMSLFGQGVATPMTGTQPNFSIDVNKKI